jgi:hypothetical protein
VFKCGLLFCFLVSDSYSCLLEKDPTRVNLKEGLKSKPLTRNLQE